MCDKHIWNLEGITYEHYLEAKLSSLTLSIRLKSSIRLKIKIIEANP